MNAGTKYPKTLIEAVRYFSDMDVAHDFFKTVRWPDGVICCPTCGDINVKYLANYRRWECKNKHPRRQFTVKVGTIMEDSPIGLDKWAVAFWLEANAKNSISSYEVHRALGITQKSAWFMQHRIRLALQEKHIGKVGGNGGSPVECDETYVGGRSKNMHAKRRRKVITGTGGDNKTVVMGILERGSKDQKSQIRTAVLHHANRELIHGMIDRHVADGSMIYTDAWKAYRSLDRKRFAHDFVDHSIEYVKGAVHTNGLENFWSLFKRCIKGTHVAIEPFHLFRYLDAEAFRFNNRECNDGQRFLLAVKDIFGKRLTYKGLTSATVFHPTSRDNAEGNENLPI